ITYHYPPYTRKLDKVQNHAHIHALVGTKVDLVVLADQPVKGGLMRVEIAGPGGVAYRQLPLVPAPGNDAHLAERRLALKEPFELTADLGAGSIYKLFLEGKETGCGESPDPGYQITVDPDRKPEVHILKIGQEQIQPDQSLVKVPLNDLVPVI